MATLLSPSFAFSSLFLSLSEFLRLNIMNVKKKKLQKVSPLSLTRRLSSVKRLSSSLCSLSSLAVDDLENRLEVQEGVERCHQNRHHTAPTHC